MPEHLCVSTGRGALCEDLTQRHVFLHYFVGSGLAPSLGSAPHEALGHGHSTSWEASDDSELTPSPPGFEHGEHPQLPAGTSLLVGDAEGPEPEQCTKFLSPEGREDQS